MDLRRQITQLFRHQLFAGSMLMFVGTTTANIGNYLYHLLMGRMLGPKGYGELESIISLLYLLTIIGTTITLVIVKFSAHLKAKKNFVGINWLLTYSSRRLALFGGIAFLLIAIASPLLVWFLHLSSFFSLILLGAAFFFLLLATLNMAVLQGLLEFKKLVAAHFSETYLKVAIAFLLVTFGFGINGAMAAFLLSGLTTYYLTLFFLKPVRQLSGKKPILSRKTVNRFAIPVFLYNLSFTSLFTTDIILIKHFFSAHEAGLYAALAVLGKIIYFASGAIPMVMFPMVVDRQSRGKSYSSLLFFSFGLVLLICSAASVIYFLFPKLMVSFLFGQEYLAMVPLVGWMAIFISFYSLAYLLVNFFLSIDRIKAVFFPLAASLGQIVLICFFHDSLKGVLQISVGVCVLLLFGLLIYYGCGQTKTSFRHCPGL